MRITRSRLEGNGGSLLEAWQYIADAPRAAVFVCPALAGRPGAYDAFCRYLCRHGMNVWLHQHWTGASVSLRDWAVEDTAEAIREFFEAAGSLPAFAVGHSFGGLFLGLSAENRRFEKILLVASPRASVWSFGWRMIPRAVFHFYVKVPALWRFRTKLPLAGLGMGGHVPARVAAECASLLRSRQFERGLAHLAMPTTHFGNFTGDLLSLCFSDDPLATLGPTHGLARLFTNASAREVREIDPRAFALPHISHLGFFHGRCRDRVWPGVVDGFLA